MEVIIGVLIPIIISLVVGILILQKSNSFSMKNKKIQAPLGYFLGLSINIVFIVLLDSIIKDFQVSIYLVLLLEVIYILANLNLAMTLLKRIHTFHYFEFLTAVFVTYIFLSVFWTRNLSEANQPTGTYGTLHSYRYAWISNVLVECKFVPNVGQNIGQSLLSAISSTLSGNQIPYLYLGIWLSISLVMFLKLTINLLIQIGVDNKTSNYASVLFIFLGCSLSFNYISVVDSGYPLLLNGYTDTLLGTAIFLSLCYVLTKKLDAKSNNFDKFVLFTMFSCSYFVAPQNIPILFLFFSISFLLLKFYSYSEVHDLKTKVITFTVASVLSVPLGGIFSPSTFRSKIIVPHVEPVKNLNFDFLPGYPFMSSTSTESYQQGEHLIMQLLATLQNENSSIQFKLMTAADFAASNLMAMALPILGFLLLIALRKNFKDFVQNSRTNYIPSVIAVSVLVLSIVLQLTIPLFFRISGYKWELTRFAIPFFVVGNLTLAVLTIRSIFKNSIKGYLLAGITILGLIGPIIYLGSNTLLNFNHFERTFKQEIYLGPGPAVDQPFCKTFINERN